VLWCEELARLTRLQQKNLLFAAERLERYNLRLVAATTHSSAELQALGWDEGGLLRLFETGLGVPSLAELKDEVPDIATHLLTQLMESDEVPLRRFSTAALNALRQHAWEGGYAELKAAVKSLALASLGEEIGEDEAAAAAGAGRRAFAGAGRAGAGSDRAAAARGARGLRAHVLRVPPGQGRRQHDAPGGKDRAGTHPPVSQAQGPRALRRHTMRIVILGAGQVGASVAEALASEANDITIVDQSREAIGDIADRLDVRTLVGNGALPSVLKNAGMDDADMLVAVTQSDSTNLVACKIARSVFNVTTRVARLRSADYLDDQTMLDDEHFAVTHAICPEQEITDYITRLIEFPEALQVLEFADGRVTLVCVRAYDGGLLVGKPIKTMREHLPRVSTPASPRFSASTSRSIPTATP
jgi:Trk K+ transport system NAD-binding subunit